jgi:hypothetical protein
MPNESLQNPFVQPLLWLFVIMLGIELGGALYEMRVVIPVWSRSLPDSVLTWGAPVDSGRFFKVATPMLALLSVAALIASRWAPAVQRPWMSWSSGAVLAICVATFAWFVPTIIMLTARRGGGLPPEAIATRAHWWLTLNYVRMAVAIAAWLGALRALSLSR